MIQGIVHQVNNESNVFHINTFSAELEEKIRDLLSSICHGISDAESGRIAYNYKSTLKELFERFKGKTNMQKKGMVGELLAHVLIFAYFDDFDTISPYFNTEERNVKKGFDLVLYNVTNSEIWITEVKSGHLHKDKNSNETSKDLLGTAKRDLNSRLNENNQALWINAITGAKKSLDEYNDKKKLVKNILEDIQDTVVTNNATSLDKNVILVSNLFNNLNDKVNINTAENFSSSVETEQVFNKHIIICIQKATLRKILSFLEGELI